MYFYDNLLVPARASNMSELLNPDCCMGPLVEPRAEGCNMRALPCEHTTASHAASGMFQVQVKFQCAHFLPLLASPHQCTVPCDL